MNALFLLLAIGSGQPLTVRPADPEPPSVVTFEPGEVRCGGVVEPPLFTDPPVPLTWDVPPYSLPNPVDLQLRFRIAPDGRPLGIAAVDRMDLFWMGGDDLPAALASWRFAPGAERRDCEIAFRAKMSPVAQAPLADLQRAIIQGRSGVRRAAVRRLYPDGSTCEQAPEPRTRASPPPEEIEQAAGAVAHSLVGFDVDAEGRPTEVRIIGTSGNEALDRHSVEAIRQSRYRPEARTGCIFSFRKRSSARLAAPPAPDRDSLRPANSTCRIVDDSWARLPETRPFPSAFRRRGIEGWAIVVYDRAPNGATGNARVLAAEPAADFGESALFIVRNARAPASRRGATGCVEYFEFRFAEDSDAAAQD